jgi:hypothetical protein
MSRSNGPYYAVLDPSDPGRMTYWRQTKTGRAPWPAKARYQPTLYTSDIPAGVRPSERGEWISQWHREHALPWWDALHAAIDADPIAAQARFAAFATRCCNCGRVLTDEASKAYGIGPECRRGFPDGVLAALAEAVGRAHANQGTTE